MRRLEQLIVFIWFWKSFFAVSSHLKREMQSSQTRLSSKCIKCESYKKKANCAGTTTVNVSWCNKSMKSFGYISNIWSQGKWWWGVFGQLAEISCSERAAPKSSLIVLVASRVPRSGSLRKLLCFQFELQFQCYLADEYFSWKLTPSTTSY